MSNVVQILNVLKKKTQQLHRKAMREKLIDYYNTINQGKLAIPSFILADMAIDKKYGVNYGR